MKILTMNTHSLREENYGEKRDIFLEYLYRWQPDIVALQEVNQTVSTPISCACPGLFRLAGNTIPVREDNHALQIARYFEARGMPVNWAYLPIKLGYGKYDEGVAVMSLGGRITEVDSCTISATDDYQNWRTRKVLGVQIENRPEWFYTVHMGWWQDELEAFVDQWHRLDAHLSEKRACNRIWLMGDFNSPADVRGQGYDMVSESGWLDAYLLAEEKNAGCTVRGAIDGWRDLPEEGVSKGMRIDQIWCSEKVGVESCSVVFNGIYEPVVSDHFGVLLKTKGEN